MYGIGYIIGGQEFFLKFEEKLNSHGKLWLEEERAISSAFFLLTLRSVFG